MVNVRKYLGFLVCHNPGLKNWRNPESPRDLLPTAIFRGPILSMVTVGADMVDPTTPLRHRPRCCLAEPFATPTSFGKGAQSFFHKPHRLTTPIAMEQTPKLSNQQKHRMCCPLRKRNGVSGFYHFKPPKKKLEDFC